MGKPRPRLPYPNITDADATYQLRKMKGGKQLHDACFLSHDALYWPLEGKLHWAFPGLILTLSSADSLDPVVVNDALDRPWTEDNTSRNLFVQDKSGGYRYMGAYKRLSLAIPSLLESELMLLPPEVRVYRSLVRAGYSH